VVVIEDFGNDEPLPQNAGFCKTNFNGYAVFGVFTIFDHL